MIKITKAEKSPMPNWSIFYFGPFYAPNYFEM